MEVKHDKKMKDSAALAKKKLPNCSTILKPFLNFQLLKSVRSTWIYEPQTLHACILYVHVNGQKMDKMDGAHTHISPSTIC